MMRFFGKLRTDEHGQGTTEYGLVLGILSIAAIGVLVTLSGTIYELFNQALTDLQTRPENS